jgi:hypothetical protein
MGFQQANDLVYFLVDGQGAIHHGFHLGSHFVHHGWLQERLGNPCKNCFYKGMC